MKENNNVLNVNPPDTLKLAATKPLKTALRDGDKEKQNHNSKQKGKKPVSQNNGKAFQQKDSASKSLSHSNGKQKPTAESRQNSTPSKISKQDKSKQVKSNATQGKAQSKSTPSIQSKPLGKLKVIFLGGVGEIGKNMTAFEYGDSILVIDCGMSFPTSDMPGVDVVIPDVTYLVENSHKLKAILLTHGHEDHIGGLPFLVQKLGRKVDIYGTKLTLGLVENKLIEHNVASSVNLYPMEDRSVVPLGDFSAEFVHVSHSIAGSSAICLRTPVGAVFHTGDFKIDYTPLSGEIMNLNRIAEIGKQGVLLLMSESTNVEKAGYTMSESVVSETMNNIFHEAKGRRIIIATFASNVDRLGMIIELARHFKRKIAVSGKSMIRYIETAKRVGYLTVDNDIFVDIDKINNIEDSKLVILSTGSQGEPMSSLTRMASGDSKVQIGSNDTIVISATPIPGNERDIYNVINKLYRLGAVVVYSALSAVHVSGHACQEELKLLYTLIHPRYFIPVHGEYRHLKQHALLVEQLGHKDSNVIITDIGDVVEVDKNTFKVAGKVQGGSVMVDGLGVGDVGNIILKDRLTLAEDGILVAVVGINRRGEIVSGPEVISRGCFFAGDDQIGNPVEELKKIIIGEITQLNIKSDANVKATIQRCVKRYFKTTLMRNPVVLPIVLAL